MTALFAVLCIAMWVYLGWLITTWPGRTVSWYFRLVVYVGGVVFVTITWLEVFDRG